MNKSLIIRWYRLDVDGQTCTRCALTQRTLDDALRYLQPQLTAAGWKIVVEDVKLHEDQIAKSNLCEIGGKPIDEIIDLRIIMNSCASCSDLTGKPEFCRSVMYKGKFYDEVPFSAFVDAIRSVTLGSNIRPGIFL